MQEEAEAPRRLTRLTSAPQRYQDYYCAEVIIYRDALLKIRGQVEPTATKIICRFLKSIGSRIKPIEVNKLGKIIKITLEENGQLMQKMEKSKWHVGEVKHGLPQKRGGLP